MPATYDLTAEFPAGDGLRQQVPYWVVGVARFANPVTWDPTIRASKQEDDNWVLQEREPLVLTSEVAQLRTSAAKEAHVTNATLTLHPASNYLVDILPGDWVVACVLNSEAHGREVAKRMTAKLSVNDWKDGLKFVGKVSSIRRSQARAKETGVLQTSYSLSCVGFAEFDSQVFFHPQLQQANILPAQLERFGVLIQNIVDGSHSSVSGGTVDINKVLPALIETIFGVGAWTNGPSVVIDGNDVNGSPNSRYLVPASIGSWLGLKQGQGPVKTFNQLLRLMMGIQHFQTPAGMGPESSAETPWKVFQPDRRPPNLMGWFPLNPPPTQASVWDILSGYSNPPLNEMYITLRSDSEGKVLPHFIVRQTPYSTSQVRGALAQHKAEAESEANRIVRKSKGTVRKADVISADATEFLELPRWKLPRDLVYQVDLGRSDALRFNMVHVSGTGYGSLTDEVGSFVRAPPVQDNADIKRHGVRPYMTGVNCVLRDLARGPKVWRDIMADIVMGQHLTLTGSITTVGISAPIAPGDNLEYDGLVFHIEAVQHIAGIMPNGYRTFQSVFLVSHGIEGDIQQAIKRQEGQDERTARFVGTSENEQDAAGVTPVTVEK